MAWRRDSRSKNTPLLCLPGSDAQRLLRIEEEALLKNQKIAPLEQRIPKLLRENDLLKPRNAIQEKLTELAKREAEVYQAPFEKEKELTDQASKLKEVTKPKSNWELQRYWVLGLATFVLRFLVGKIASIVGGYAAEPRLPKKDVSHK